MLKEDLDLNLFNATKIVRKDEPLNSKDCSNEDVSVLYSLGYSLYEAGDYAHSKKIFQQLVISKPLEQKYWFGLASSLQLERHYNEALIAWSMSALILDEDPFPHFHAAECLISLNQQEEAAKALKASKTRITATPEHLNIKNQIEVMEKAWGHKSEKVDG